jgi:microcystin-dependent protein
MSEPFLGEIQIFGFNFSPRSWALCDGQLLPINQNQALFSLLGTTYGGDGRTNFALPDLRGRAPMHEGTGHTLGQKAGEENHTLAAGEMPQHTHSARASANSGNSPVPVNNFLAAANNVYRAPDNLTALSPGTVGTGGGGQGHNNMQPYLTLNFCIALAGLFPSQN